MIYCFKKYLKLKCFSWKVPVLLLPSLRSLFDIDGTVIQLLNGNIFILQRFTYLPLIVKLFSENILLYSTTFSYIL